MSRHIFVAATAAPDAGADVAKQTALTLARLDERLRAEHSSLGQALVITVYLRNATGFAAMNDAYRQAWQTAPPTRTTVVADLLTPGALVEMSAIAAPADVDRRIVHPASWIASPNPYSYALRSNDTLFLSGLIARNGRDNTVVTGDIAVQTHAVLDNAGQLLDAAGLSFPHIVSARVFLPDLGDFAEMNRVYRERFPEAPPARATVGASLTSTAYKVEMTFVASAGPRRAVDGEGPRNPNLSAAIAAGGEIYVSGLLAEGDALKADAAAQTRDILRRLDAILTKESLSRSHVRELLVYATGTETARAATAECTTAFGSKVALTPVKVALAASDAKVEIMTVAQRE
jgi:reactive intermediate/imine deaminase